MSQTYFSSAFFLLNRVFAGRKWRRRLGGLVQHGARRVTRGGCGSAQRQPFTPGTKPRPPVLAILTLTGGCQSGSREK